MHTPLSVKDVLIEFPHMAKLAINVRSDSYVFNVQDVTQCNLRTSDPIEANQQEIKEDSSSYYSYCVVFDNFVRQLFEDNTSE